MSDPILGKIVMDFSRKYVSVYLCEGDGSIKDFEHFRWPYRLELKETREETKSLYDFLYDYVNNSVNLQEDGSGGAESEKGDPTP